jgi:dolichol kinase
MAIFSFLSIFVTLWLLPGSPLSPHSVPLDIRVVLGLSLAGSLVATTAEALSPAGTDNLSVPLLSGLAMYILNNLM